MDDKQSNTNKPLRTTANKMQDILNTYLRNQNQKKSTSSQDNEKIIKITDDSDDSQKSKLLDNKEVVITEKDLLDQDLLAEFIGKFEELIKERDDLQDQVKRVAAEMENFRRRSIREKQEMIDYANERLLFKLLPIIDDLGSAIEAGKKNNDLQSLMTGIELIYNKTLKLLEEAGVKPMEDPKGTPFNFEFHEALAVIPSDLPEGYVAQTVQSGYLIHNKVLRHAKVLTSAGQPDEEQVWE